MTTFNITKETIEKVLDVLSDHWFSDDGEYNNDDIMEADKALRAEVKAQE